VGDLDANPSPEMDNERINNTMETMRVIDEVKPFLTGKLYRGVFIYHDAKGFAVLGAEDQVFRFESEGEARGFVDSCIMAQFAAWRTAKDVL